MANKNFDIFKKECLHLQEEWGLSGWQIDFELDTKEKDCYAYINASAKDRKATITFSNLKNKHSNLKRTAKHEMIHLLLARYTDLSEFRYVRKGEIMEAEEEVVQMLLKIIR